MLVLYNCCTATGYSDMDSPGTVQYSATRGRGLPGIGLQYRLSVLVRSICGRRSGKVAEIENPCPSPFPPTTWQCFESISHVISISL